MHVYTMETCFILCCNNMTVLDPHIWQFNNPCNEFTSVCSMFVYTRYNTLFLRWPYYSSTKSRFKLVLRCMTTMLIGIRKSSANISSERINSAVLFWDRISMDTIRLKYRTFIHGINEVMFLFLDQHFKHNLFVVFEG